MPSADRRVTADDLAARAAARDREAERLRTMGQDERLAELGRADNAPQAFAPVRDWNNTSNVITGAPPWFSYIKEDLLRRTANLSHKVMYGYGLSPEEQETYQRLQKQYEDLSKLEGEYSLPFSITGNPADTVDFTPEQLLRARDSEQFAARLLSSATGMQDLPPAEIRHFQERIVTSLPHLPDLVSKQQQAERSAREIAESSNAEKRSAFERDARQANEAYDKSLREYDTRFDLNNSRQIDLERAIQSANALTNPEEVLRADPTYKSDLDRFFRRIKKQNPHHEEFLTQYALATDRDVPFEQRWAAHKQALEIARKANELEGQELEKKKPVRGEVPQPEYLPLPHADTEENLLSRIGAVGQQRKNAETYARVAPMNQFHQMAQHGVMRDVESQKRYIDRANEGIHRAEERDIAGRVNPMVNEGVQPVYSRVQNYRNLWQKNVIDALEKEAKKNLLAEIMPQLHAQYASTGEYHTGKREKMERKYIERMQEQLERDRAKILYETERESQNRAEADLNRMLQGAQVAGSAEQHQHEANLRASEASRNLGMINKELSARDAQALSQLANTRQQQQQNEITERMRAHQERQLEPWKRLQMASHINAAHASPAEMTTGAAQQAAPRPPNPMNTTMGLMGQMFGMANPTAPNPIGFKKGGSVKAKYASGGRLPSLVEQLDIMAHPEGEKHTRMHTDALAHMSHPLQERHEPKKAKKSTPSLPKSPGMKIVPETHAERFAQMAKHVQADPYDKDLNTIAGEMRDNYRPNPMNNWINHVSAEMLANNTGDPLVNMGVGAKNAMLANEKHVDRELLAKKNAADLYHQMNESLRNQHKFLADYDAKMREHEETARHHRAHEGLTAGHYNEIGRHHRALEESARQKYQVGHEPIHVGDRVINPTRKIGLTPQDRAALEANKKTLDVFEEKLVPYERMKSFIGRKKMENDLPLTGPVISRVGNWTDTAREYQRHLNDIVSGDFPSGVLTNAKLRFTERKKPTEADSIEATEEFVEDRSATAQKHLAFRKFVQEMGAYEIPPRISTAAYEKWLDNNEEGDPVDYVKAMLEGTEVRPSSRHSGENHQSSAALAHSIGIR